MVNSRPLKHRCTSHFQLMGLLLLGIGISFGIWYLVFGISFYQAAAAISMDAYDLTNELFGSTVLLIIVFSCIIVVVSFFGCCGAWKVVFQIF